jgi:hypothetical protein
MKIVPLRIFTLPDDDDDDDDADDADAAVEVA